MFEIISLHGEPFKKLAEPPTKNRPEPPQRPRRRRLSLFRKLVSAVALLGLALVAGTALFWCGQRFLFLEAHAKHGEANAQYWLGKSRFRAAHPSGDYAEALNWLRLAAAQGHVDAQASLGFVYAKGIGVQQNSAEALSWFRKAAAPRETPPPMTIQAQALQLDFHRLLKWSQQLESRGLEIATKNLKVAAVAQGRVYGEVNTLDGNRYLRLHVERVAPDGLTVAHNGGLSKLKREVLPPELARLCEYAVDQNVAPFAAWTETAPAVDPVKVAPRTPARPCRPTASPSAAVCVGVFPASTRTPGLVD